MNDAEPRLNWERDERRNPDLINDADRRGCCQSECEQCITPADYQ